VFRPPSSERGGGSALIVFVVFIISQFVAVRVEFNAGEEDASSIRSLLTEEESGICHRVFGELRCPHREVTPMASGLLTTPLSLPDLPIVP